MGDPAVVSSEQTRPDGSNNADAGPSVESPEFDPVLFATAEGHVEALISRIQPTELAESRRRAVYLFVQRLIRKCFDCQVFTFGSVPLKTYLPDGDIDLTAFTQNQSLKDTWAHEVRAALEEEERRPSSEFRVKEVQYIQAEVKLVKCLVENIVVDISVNQLGGLCTLCFLEEVDRLIGQNHLFKRSIILVKAWCYYESRLLGAHHGLISTYALETLVLYIFHVYHSVVKSPLQVLLKFLEYFSTFDWEGYILSLRGPIPLAGLPSFNAEPPKPAGGGGLLLSNVFLDECNAAYAVIPGMRDGNGRVAGAGGTSRPFAPKFMNILDPLLASNNLGRSVSKGNFYRIRSAFTYGAKKLKAILKSPRDKLVVDIHRFFANTWERHGSGQRPDAFELRRGPVLRPRLPEPLPGPPPLAFAGGRGGLDSALQGDLPANWPHVRPGYMLMQWPGMQGAPIESISESGQPNATPLREGDVVRSGDTGVASQEEEEGTSGASQLEELVSSAAEERSSGEASTSLAGPDEPRRNRRTAATAGSAEGGTSHGSAGSEAAAEARSGRDALSQGLSGTPPGPNAQGGAVPGVKGQADQDRGREGLEVDPQSAREEAREELPWRRQKPSPGTGVYVRSDLPPNYFKTPRSPPAVPAGSFNQEGFDLVRQMRRHSADHMPMPRNDWGMRTFPRDSSWDRGHAGFGNSMQGNNKGPKASPPVGPQHPSLHLGQYSPRMQALAMAHLGSSGSLPNGFFDANRLGSGPPHYLYPRQGGDGGQGEGSPRLLYHQMQGVPFGGPPGGFSLPPPPMMLPPSATMSRPLGPGLPVSLRAEEGFGDAQQQLHSRQEQQFLRSTSGAAPPPLPLALQIPPHDQPPYPPALNQGSGSMRPPFPHSSPSDIPPLMHMFLPPSPSISGPSADILQQQETPRSAPPHTPFHPAPAGKQVPLDSKAEPGAQHEPPVLDPYTADGRIREQNPGQQISSQEAVRNEPTPRARQALPEGENGSASVGQKDKGSHGEARSEANDRPDLHSAARRSDAAGNPADLVHVLPIPARGSTLSGTVSLPQPHVEPLHTAPSGVRLDEDPMVRSRSADPPCRTMSEPSLVARGSSQSANVGLLPSHLHPGSPFGSTLSPFSPDSRGLSAPLPSPQAFSPFHFFPLGQLPPGMATLLPFFPGFGAPGLGPLLHPSASQGGRGAVPDMLSPLSPDQLAALEARLASRPGAESPAALPSPPALGVGARLRAQGIPVGVDSSASGYPEGNDLLSGDFESHLHNLEWGRICQSHQGTSAKWGPQQQGQQVTGAGPPPGHSHGSQQWEGPGRPGGGAAEANGLEGGSRHSNLSVRPASAEVLRMPRGNQGAYAEGEGAKPSRPAVQYGGGVHQGQYIRTRTLDPRPSSRGSERSQSGGGHPGPAHEGSYRGGGQRGGRGSGKGGDGRSWVVSEASQARTRDAAWQTSDNVFTVRALNSPPPLPVNIGAPLSDRPHPVVQLGGNNGASAQQPSPHAPSPAPLPPSRSRTPPPIVLQADGPPVLSAPFVIGAPSWENEGRPTPGGGAPAGPRPGFGMPAEGEANDVDAGGKGQGAVAAPELSSIPANLPPVLVGGTALSRAGSANDLASRRSYSLSDEDFPPLASTGHLGGSRSTTNSPRSARGGRFEHKSAQEPRDS